LHQWADGKVIGEEVVAAQTDREGGVIDCVCLETKARAKYEPSGPGDRRRDLLGLGHGAYQQSHQQQASREPKASLHHGRLLSQQPAPGRIHPAFFDETGRWDVGKNLTKLPIAGEASNCWQV
jgi:hypothetical protein